VRFRCTVHANPSDALTYTWFVGGRRLRVDPETEDTTSEFVLESADRRLHGHVVKCEVGNRIGKNEISSVLDVSCKYSCSEK
jgi:hypothetical protein